MWPACDLTKSFQVWWLSTHAGARPAGALATAGVLVVGLAAFRQGNKNLSQQMMRTRVMFQGATVAIMLGSSGTGRNVVAAECMQARVPLLNGPLHIALAGYLAVKEPTSSST